MGRTPCLMLPTPAQQLTYAKSRYPIDPTCPNGWTIYRTADAQAQKPQEYFSDMSYSWGYLLDDARPQCIIDEAQTGGSDAGYFGRNAGALTFFFVYVPALAVTGNPILHAGSDGTNARTVKTDTSGNQIVVGTVADGVAVSGNPVLVGGYDGTNTRMLRTNSSGNLAVIGSGTAGTATSGASILSVQGCPGGVEIPVVPTAASKTVISTATTTTVKASAGTILHDLLGCWRCGIVDCRV